jgi:hypothetical protein
MSEVKVKEGICEIVRIGEVVVIVDKNKNVFSTNDMFIMRLTKEKMNEYINQAKEEKDETI